MVETKLQPDASKAKRTPYATKRGQFYALLVLFGIYACHSLDRGIPSIVMEPIKRQFHASDTQLGLIAGGYTIAFLVAMLPIGILIDRVNRLRLLAVLVTVWSGFTALAGLATSLPLLILARLGVGTGEAGGHPISMSLIGDIFPQERRGRAVGMFYVATGTGSILSFLVGGFIAHTYGWRAAFFLAGAPGLFLALLALSTLREPERGAADNTVAARASEKAPPVAAVFAFILASWPIINIAIGVMLASSVNASLNFWLGSYFVRRHHLNLMQVGFIGALGPGVLQACGAFTSGFAADWVSRGGAHRVGYVAALAMFMLAPLGIAFAAAPGVALAIGLLLCMGVFTGSWMAPTFTLLISITESRMRGVVVGLVQVLAAIGSGFGPLVVGMISDRLGGHIETALMIGLAIAAWAALHSFLGARGSARLLHAAH